MRNFLCFLVDLVSPGDSFSGTANVKGCFEVDNHPFSIVVKEVAGNLFSGVAINRIGDQVRSRDVVGFFHVSGRQVIIAASGRYTSTSVTLLCSYDASSIHTMDCRALTDHMTKECGSFGMDRDRKSE